jgi:hypothetical protein
VERDLSSGKSSGNGERPGPCRSSWHTLRGCDAMIHLVGIISRAGE